MLNKQRFILLLLPFVWLLAIITSLLESYFYQGFIYKHANIDSLVIYFLYIILGFICLYFFDESKNKIFLIFHQIYVLSIYLFGFAFYFFYITEKIHYSNYVFSTYHLQPSLLATPFALSIFALIFSSKKVILNSLKNPKILLGWFPMIAVMLWILIPNITDITLSSYKNLQFIVRNPKATYDQKMQEKVGKQFYDYVLFIKNNTPEDSSILLPPFPAYPWPQTGNIPYMTYFLYPRKLYNGDEYSSKYDLVKDNIDYVLIDWGETIATSGEFTHGWPKFDIKSDQITYFNKDGSINISNNNYLYEKTKNEELWGIIKVKK